MDHGHDHLDHDDHDHRGGGPAGSDAPGHGARGHGGHGHSAADAPLAGIAVAVVLNAALAVGQVVAGVVFHSVAVLADAGHQVVDAAGLVLGLVAVRLARRPATARRTWGWGRADAVGAQISAVVLIGSLVWVLIEASRRLAHPESVQGLGVVVIGVLGTVVNGGSLLAIGHAKEHLSIRAARLHLLGDFAGSLLLIVTGLLVRYTGWDRLDPIASLLLSVLLVHSAVQLLRHSTAVLLDAAPDHLDVAEIVELVRAEGQVRDLHHVHVWTIAPGVTALSGHLAVEGALSVHDAQADVQRVELLLRQRFGISHTTLQVECHPCATPAHD